jgi:hypothetical protein
MKWLAAQTISAISYQRKKLIADSADCNRPPFAIRLVFRNDPDGVDYAGNVTENRQ